MKPKTTKKIILKASFWVFFAFGLSQTLRLGGNLIVTRLLVPEMFGIMAVVNAVIHGIVMLSDVGLWAYAVRHKDGDKEYIYNAIWTLKVIRGVLIFLFILLVVGLLYFISSIGINNEGLGVYTSPQFLIMLAFLSTSSVFSGFNSMASPIRSRELKRGRLELMELLAQFTGIVVMVTWAYLYPSIWALAGSSLISVITLLILSYCLFPYRHKFILDKSIARDVFHFGKWIMLASVLTYIVQAGDKLYFGAVISANELGIYSIAAMLAMTASTITNQVTSKILFPVFSEFANHSRAELSKKYYRLRLRLDIGLYIAAAFLLVFSPRIIELLYDERYQAAGKYLQILAISIPAVALTSAAQECLTAIGHTKVRSQVMFVRAFILAITLPLFFYIYGFIGAIIAVAVNPWLGLPVLVFRMKKEKIYNFKAELQAMPIGLIALGILYFLNGFF